MLENLLRTLLRSVLLHDPLGVHPIHRGTARGLRPENTSEIPGKYFMQFLLFVGQHQLGENYLTYSHLWGSQNTLGKNMHYILRIVSPLRIDHVRDNFRPHLGGV